MNPRRIVRTLIVLLVTIVARWLVRDPVEPTPASTPTPPQEPSQPLPVLERRPAHDPTLRLEPHDAGAPSQATPRSDSSHDEMRPDVASVAARETAIARLEPAAREFEPRVIASQAPVSPATTSAPIAVIEPPDTARESHIPSFERPVAEREAPAAVYEAPVALPGALVALHEAPVALREPPVALHESAVAVLEPAVAKPEPAVAMPEAPTAVRDASTEPRLVTRETPIAIESDAWRGDWDLPTPEAAKIAFASRAETPNTVDEARPSEAMASAVHPNGSLGHESNDAPSVAPAADRPRPRRRRSENERPGRLLGGAGFLLAAIACFIASFVLFVRLTTPDRSAPVAYAVVPYVAATERDVPPALASFAGDIPSGDTWLVLRLPVATRYVALTGLRTVDRWNTNQFALAGSKPTSASNAASCYSGVGVANGPPELTPLPTGFVVREETTSSLATERLVRVDVGALLADASATKTLVCAIASPAQTGFAAYAATIGVPNVPASDATGSRVKLAALPLAVDFSAFGNASAMRFTQTALAVATDPLHATLDVAGFETFAYDDPEGDARRDVLLFIAGALATIGAVAVADALRPWLGIERR